MSKPSAQSDNSLVSIEPGKDAAGKSLRTDPKADANAAGNGVFRLDVLAPGAGEGGGDAFAVPKSKVSQSLLFFVVLMIIGGSILFFMRQIGIGPMASFGKIKAPDYDVTKDLKGKSGDHKRVLKDLSESSVRTQVPIEQVQKNPFKLSDMVAGSSIPADDSEAEAKRAAAQRQRDAEAKRKMVESAFQTLKVHAILVGSNPVARINDNAVRIGDSIDDLFTVKAIRDREVELEADGQIYKVSLDDDTGGKPTKGGKRK